MLNKLSADVSISGCFDQAACMAQTLCVADLPPDKLDHLSFHLVAPQNQIASGVFGNLVDRRDGSAEGGGIQWRT